MRVESLSLAVGFLPVFVLVFCVLFFVFDFGLFGLCLVVWYFLGSLGLFFGVCWVVRLSNSGWGVVCSAIGVFLAFDLLGSCV